jgi:hypothetical protein
VKQKVLYFKAVKVVLKKIIKKIPGFRTETKWKMALATIGYLSILIVLFNQTGATLRDKIINVLTVMIFFGVSISLLANVGNVRSKLPIFKKNKIGYNILGGLIVFIILGIVISISNNFKSLEQKQLDALSIEQSESSAAASKAVASEAAASKAAASKAVAVKAAADKAAADKAAADKTAADKAAADKAAADKAAADKAKYLAQFTWYDSNFGVTIDSAHVEYGFFTADGRAISLKNKSYSYIELTIGLYSKNGSKIGTAMTNITDLSAGTTWQFEAMGSTGSNGSCTYKVESVEGW